jgi:hypothetical protein
MFYFPDNDDIRTLSEIFKNLGVILGVNQVALGLQLMLGGYGRFDRARRLHRPGKMTLGGLVRLAINFVCILNMLSHCGLCPLYCPQARVDSTFRTDVLRCLRT